MMTTAILLDDEIRIQVLNILSGNTIRKRDRNWPQITILSPWISNVDLEMVSDPNQWDEESTFWFSIDYGIRYINLPYAILFLKLDLGVQVNIVTLPIRNKADSPREMRNYEYVKPILDFLDEVGCNVYTNPILHSKLILSNDLALIGSFNLSKAALYDNEEVGISIDDVDNLRILENYARRVIESSTPFGFTANLRRKYSSARAKSVTEKVTRGWLYEQVVMDSTMEDWPSSSSFDCQTAFRGFLVFYYGYEHDSLYTWRIAEEVGSSPGAFYEEVLKNFFQANKELLPNDPWMTAQEKRDALRIHRKSYLEKRFNYKGEAKTGEILAFLRTKLVRHHFPKVRLQLVPMESARRYLAS